MKISDGYGASIVNLTSSERGKVFSHLGKAMNAIPSDHQAQQFLKAAANQLGGIVSDSPGTIDRNVDARAAGASQATGASDIADKSVQVHRATPGQDLFKSFGSETAGAANRRDAVVKALYSVAARTADKKRRGEIEKVAMTLDSLNILAVNAMTEADWAAYRDGDQAAIRKAQRRTADRFTEIFKAGSKPSGDRRTFAGRHGG